MGWSAVLLAATCAASAPALAPPAAPALGASRLGASAAAARPRRAPSAAACVRMQSNIFEQVGSAAAKAVGKTINKATGLPELSDAEQEAMERAMLEGKLDFDQFLVQMQVMAKAGSMSATMAKIPGVGDEIDPQAAQLAEKKLARYEAFCAQMSPEERKSPELLLPGNDGAALRAEQLAGRCGVGVEEIRTFLAEFVVLRKTSQAFAQRKGPEEVKAVMAAAQEEAGLTNRQERRLAAKEAKKAAKKKGGGGGGFG